MTEMIENSFPVAAINEVMAEYYELAELKKLPIEEFNEKVRSIYEK